MLGGARLESPSTRYQLNYQLDGNLVLYGPSGPVWDSKTAGSSVGQVAMNTGGNLIVYDAAGRVAWVSGTDGNPGASLSVNENGTVTLVHNGTVIWTGGTPQAAPPAPPPGTDPTPQSFQLPGPPGRDRLCRVKAAFNADLMVTTKQLGTVPSWGPEVGMLTDYADRLTTYRAHAAWGASHIVLLAAGPPYVEPGVVYPSNTAFNNDWTNDLDTMYSRLVECIANGLWPVLGLGGDGGYQYIRDNLARFVNKIRTGPAGDLTPYIVYLSGTDSIDSIGLGVYKDNGDTEDALLVFIRQTIGNDAVQAKENYFGDPPMWKIPPTAGSDAVDVFLIESAGIMLGNEPAPKIIAGTWDAGHNDYAPVYDKPETPWTVFWLLMKRTLPSYTAPADQPFDILVPVTGSATNPAFKGTAPVSSDSRGGNGAWYARGTPRGRQYFVWFEFGTYPGTHGQAGPGQIQRTREYGAACGFDSVC